MFNPKVGDFMKDNPDQTMLGFFWSLYWRFYVVIFGVVIVIEILALLLNK